MNQDHESDLVMIRCFVRIILTPEISNMHRTAHTDERHDTSIRIKRSERHLYVTKPIQ